MTQILRAIKTYRKAIFQHKDQIAGKVVLDVGCGTGILSIFCAQAGARRLSIRTLMSAKKIIMENNLCDTVIVLGGQVEERANPSECLVLSTAPEDPPTHWQQTLIYFTKPKEMEQDHVFEGCVTLRQYITNFPRWSIDIDYN